MQDKTQVFVENQNPQIECDGDDEDIFFPGSRKFFHENAGQVIEKDSACEHKNKLRLSPGIKKQTGKQKRYVFTGKISPDFVQEHDCREKQD